MQRLFTVYMIMFENGYLYTGSTANLFRRSREHHKLGAKPRVIFKQRFGTREEAFQREKQLKGWSRSKKLALSEGRLQDLSLLSKRRAGKPLLQSPSQTLKRV